MNPEFFRIKFDRIGFKFKENPIGARVLIEWQGKDLLGEIWAASYSPERGYYEIGVRSVSDKTKFAIEST